MLINKDKLVTYIKKLNEPTVLVIGDMALDEMLYGDTERISREAPVLILQHTHTKLILGCASNAAHNASVLNNGKVFVVGVAGQDFQAQQLKEAFGIANIDCKYLVCDKTRKTITKTRISGSCSQSVTQQIVRIDRQTNELVSKETENKIIQNIETLINQVDAVILSDYHIGTLSDEIIEKTIELAIKNNKIIVADTQRDLYRYKNVTAITPNLPDTQKFAGYALTDEEKIKSAGKDILEKINSKSVLITCGAEGMMVIEPEQAVKIPVFNKSKVFDVTGAGDTVTAIYTMALAIGAEPAYAAVIGNIAASIVIKQFGCATTSIDEILQEALKKEFNLS